MRNLKRALSLALATVMTLGLMVVGTGAVSYDDVTSEDNQEAIEVLQAVGIMTGVSETEFNPERLDYVNERLNLIYNLQQKHRVTTIEALLELAENYRHQLNDISSFDERIAELNQQKEALYNKVSARNGRRR